MRNSPDPSIHREREKQVIDHVERLLNDDRLRIDTTQGRWPVVALRRDVRKEDREVDLKRLMSHLGRPDRSLQARMPVGRMLTADLSATRFFIFRAKVGRLKVVCMPPSRDLLEDQQPGPMGVSELTAALAQFGEDDERVPTTLVMVATSGFTADARELADRRPDRTVILVEPNEAGGWTVSGPTEARALVDLFDPEVDAEKRQRVRQEIEKRRADLLNSGLSADRLAETTALPLGLVEEELRAYAGEGQGLVARRLEGNMVLFRQASVAASPGGVQMPFIQRVKAMFGVKGDNERKIAMLSERRAAMSIQRDRAFEEMGVLEAKEAELREQFKANTSSLTRRRITSQLVQLRKDLERRQQLMAMLNQQVNVVSTHLHNLELVQQGQAAQLPDSEELANDAAAAEEVLAELQANSEMAASITAAGPSGLSEEEQALYEELEREAAGSEPASSVAGTERAPTKPVAQRPVRQTSVGEDEIVMEPPPVPTRPQRQRGEAEPG